MPTFSNPVDDAAEARESVRALAHASRAFADPDDTYQVVGELLCTLRSLEQVLAGRGGARSTPGQGVSRQRRPRGWGR